MAVMAEGGECSFEREEHEGMRVVLPGAPWERISTSRGDLQSPNDCGFLTGPLSSGVGTVLSPNSIITQVPGDFI